MLPRARPTLTTSMCGAVQAVGGGLGWSLFPALSVEIARDLSLSETMAGIAWGATPLGIALAAPVGGAAVDRYGARRVVAVALLLGALACAARALAGDAWAMSAAMFVFGLHVGFVAPAIPKALGEHVPLAHLGRANGIALLSYTFGTAFTMLGGRTVLAPAFGGWRETMVAAGAAMALTAGAWWVLIRDRTQASRHARLADILSFARDGQLLRVAGMHFFLFGGYLALLGMLPRALAGIGASREETGIAIAAWLFVAGAANLAGPWLSDRLGRRRLFPRVGAVVAAGGLTAVALLEGWTSFSFGFLLVAAIGGGAFAPLLFAIPIELPSIGPAKAGAAFGLLLLVGQAGGFLLSVGSSTVAEASGYPVALLFLAAAHLAILLPTLGLTETGRAGKPIHDVEVSR